MSNTLDEMLDRISKLKKDKAELESFLKDLSSNNRVRSIGIAYQYDGHYNTPYFYDDCISALITRSELKERAKTAIDSLKEEIKSLLNQSLDLE